MQVGELGQHERRLRIAERASVLCDAAQHRARIADAYDRRAAAGIWLVLRFLADEYESDDDDRRHRHDRAELDGLAAPLVGALLEALARLPLGLCLLLLFLTTAHEIAP